MVFFNCNGCGEAMKKNQVEKHSYRCRQCFVLSCVDCGKDFRGNDYQTHTKCMTEAEKYCGKGYVPKVNKGEAKQEQWIESVQAAIAKSTSKPSLQKLLERLQDYPNIPRKKAKFENFLKNSLRVSNPTLISDVWSVLMEAAPTKQNAPQKAEGVELSAQESRTSGSTENEEENEIVSEQKLNKREKKEERQKKNKKEKKDDVSNSTGSKKGKRKKDEDDENEDSKDSKRGKRRKREEMENDDIPENEEERVSEKKKRKKDNGDAEDSITENTNGTILQNGVDANDNNNTNHKFDLKTTIKEIVKKKEEISLKKLRKKVLSEFLSQNASNYSEERLLSEFDKKITSMKKLKVHKDKVMLNSVFLSKYSS